MGECLFIKKGVKLRKATIKISKILVDSEKNRHFNETLLETNFQKNKEVV